MVRHETRTGKGEEVSKVGKSGSGKRDPWSKMRSDEKCGAGTDGRWPIRFISHRPGAIQRPAAGEGEKVKRAGARGGMGSAPLLSCSAEFARLRLGTREHRRVGVSSTAFALRSSPSGSASVVAAAVMSTSSSSSGSALLLKVFALFAARMPQSGS